jgi:hypothetical protein
MSDNCCPAKEGTMSDTVKTDYLYSKIDYLYIQIFWKTFKKHSMVLGRRMAGQTSDFETQHVTAKTS